MSEEHGTLMVELGQALPAVPSVFNLNDSSAVYVAARSLDEAIEYYLGIMCPGPISSPELGMRMGLISNPVEVPFEEWRSMTYFDEEVHPAKEISLEKHALQMLLKGEQLPFLLATEEW